MSLTAVVVTALLTLPGCAALQGMQHRHGVAPASATPATPRPADTPATSVEGARALVAKGRHQEALAALDRALSQHKGQEDAVLMEKAVILASAEVADYPHAQEALDLLLRKHPRSTYGPLAATLADVLARLRKSAQDNEALRQDLKQILDIDMEAERRRRSGS